MRRSEIEEGRIPTSHTQYLGRVSAMKNVISNVNQNDTFIKNALSRYMKQLFQGCFFFVIGIVSCSKQLSLFRPLVMMLPSARRRSQDLIRPS